jgi:hypothetical protein
MGGKFHLKLNMGTRPIANKYREGKMKSTLKRELKAREAVKMETITVSSVCSAINRWMHVVRRGVEVSKPSSLLNAHVCLTVHLLDEQVNISLSSGVRCGGR